MEFTPAEGRVLGCLVEKELTTPQLYPLTENALITACNQTTNREPVVTYDVATVRLAVRSLRDQTFVRTVHRTGERSDKHLHLLEQALALSPAQVTLLAVLLLRGPQTPGELRARCERMHAFETLEQVTETLEAMIDRDEPIVAPLERAPGRKETRYGQLLAAEEPGHVDARPAQPKAADEATSRSRVPRLDLAREVEQLRAEVAELRAQVDGLMEAFTEARPQ